MPTARDECPVKCRVKIVKLHVVVVGAGAFGGWTALMLRRGGAQVTLVDAWGPGPCAGEFGRRDADHPRHVRRARHLHDGWRRARCSCGRRTTPRRAGRVANAPFFHRTGALWMFSGDESFGQASIEPMQAAGLPVEWLDPERRRPAGRTSRSTGVSRVLWEPEAGYALARRACEHVVETFVAEGGTYLVGQVAPLSSRRRRSRCGRLDARRAARRCTADRFVLRVRALARHGVSRRRRRAHPSVAAGVVLLRHAGRRRALAAAADAGVARLPRAACTTAFPATPIAASRSPTTRYGATFDPTSGDRAHTPEMLAEARAFLRLRFPAIADAPLLGSEVCQYELTAGFALPHRPSPRRSRMSWLVGGGSGHGFKMGPALGEYVDALVLEQADTATEFRLAHR